MLPISHGRIHRRTLALAQVVDIAETERNGATITMGAIVGAGIRRRRGRHKELGRLDDQQRYDDVV